MRGVESLRRKIDPEIRWMDIRYCDCDGCDVDYSRNWEIGKRIGAVDSSGAIRSSAQ